MAWYSDFGVFLVLLVVLAFSSLRIFREYERGVVFTLGRFWKVKGPGLVLVIPGIQQAVRVDLRTVVLEVPTQDVISRDNVSVKVSGSRVSPRRRCGKSHHPGRGLPQRHKSVGADHVAIGVGQTPAGRHAGGEGATEHRHP